MIRIKVNLELVFPHLYPDGGHIWTRYYVRLIRYRYGINRPPEHEEFGWHNPREVILMSEGGLLLRSAANLLIVDTCDMHHVFAGRFLPLQITVPRGTRSGAPNPYPVLLPGHPKFSPLQRGPVFMK